MAELLPPNATAQQRAIAQACARLGELPVPLRELWNPDTCPRPLLPWLAWALGVEDWDATWPEATQRAIIKASIPLRRIRGTRRAVEDAVRPYGSTIAIREWWEKATPGTPHTFDVILSYGAGLPALTTAYQDAIVRAIDRAKPLRSHYTLSLAISSRAEIGAFGFARAGTFTRLRLEG